MQTGVSVYNQKQNGKQLGPDETVHYELSHLDLHCLQRYLYWSVGMKGLIEILSGLSGNTQ